MATQSMASATDIGWHHGCKECMIHQSLPASLSDSEAIAMVKLTKILCPVDFSELSRKAMYNAIELASTFGAELHLLHVFEGYDAISLNPELVISPMSEWLPKLRELCRAKLEALPEGEWAGRCRVIHANREGSAIAEICHYAKQHDIDLIVLGTHGRTGLSHLLMGSVAENVVRSAPCPVLTIREKT